jgi:EmrB/QacA subfamily drug resistance transporter
MTSNPIAQTLPPHKWLVLAAVGTGVFLGTLDGSIINVSLPTLSQTLEADFPTIQWVILGYLLTVTSLLLSMGRLADIRGKKKIYQLGFGIFIIGSMLCGLAPGAGWLIAFRVLQAVGAAMITALGAAIVTAAFPPSERGKALGLIGTIVSAGIATGPALGGLLIGTVGWRAIFFVNVPVGLVGVLMVQAFVPDDKPAGGQRFDFAGAGTLFISLFCLLLALTMGQQLGFAAPVILALFIGAVVFLVIFLLIENRIKQPMIDLGMFRNELFSVSLLTGFLCFLALGGTFILPFYLQDVQGYSVAQVGLLLSVLPIMLSVFSPLSGMLSDRLGTRGLATAGLLLMALAFFWLSTLQIDTSTIAYMLRVVPLGIGIGLFNSPNNSAIMGSVTKERLGIASGFLAITRTLGQTTGVAVIGAIFAARAAVYAGQALTPDLSAANPQALVNGLHDAMLLVGVMMVGATFISAIGFWLERRRTTRPQRVSGRAD